MAEEIVDVVVVVVVVAVATAAVTGDTAGRLTVVVVVVGVVAVADFGAAWPSAAVPRGGRAWYSAGSDPETPTKPSTLLK